MRGKEWCWRRSWRADPREKDATVEQEKSVRSPPPEEEGAADTTCDELTQTLIPRPPAPLGGGGRKFGSKVKPRKKGGVGGRCFSDLVLFLIILF